ncbi:MAG: hypothetical protein JWP52_3391, partial [Rhizobacter sp.]|nr:hypothetical protein [Rhizobacter sp.]
MKKIALALAAAAAFSMFASQAMAQPAGAASAPAVNAQGKVQGEGQPTDVATPKRTGTPEQRRAIRKAAGVDATKSGTVQGEATPPEAQARPAAKKPTRAGAHRLNE